MMNITDSQIERFWVETQKDEVLQKVIEFVRNG